MRASNSLEARGSGLEARVGSPPESLAPSPQSPSEGQRETALPGDVVLGLVEPVAIELVDEVATLRAEADAPEPVLEPRAEVAGELGPGVAGAELVDADGAGPAEQVRRHRGGPGLDGIPQHQGGIIVELVELAAARERGAANAVLRPAAAGADADVPVQPHRPVNGADPAQPPVGAAGGIEVGRPGEAAERAAQGETIGPGPDRLGGRGAGLGPEPEGRAQRHAQRHDEIRDETPRHRFLRRRHSGMTMEYSS